MGEHHEITGAGVHRPYIKIFAGTAARTGDATVYTIANLYAKALQLDTMQEYVLTSFASPITWTATAGGGGGGGGGGFAPILAIKTDTFSYNGANDTWVTVPGFSVPIQPSTTDALIRIELSLSWSCKNSIIHGRIVRDSSTPVVQGDANGSSIRCTFSKAAGNTSAVPNDLQAYEQVASAVTVYDEPSTTSVKTYEVQIMRSFNYTNVLYVNRGLQVAGTYGGATVSTLSAQEMPTG